jgi:hypothetical protein
VRTLFVCWICRVTDSFALSHTLSLTPTLSFSLSLSLSLSLSSFPAPKPCAPRSSSPILAPVRHIHFRVICCTSRHKSRVDTQYFPSLHGCTIGLWLHHWPLASALAFAFSFFPAAPPFWMLSASLSFLCPFFACFFNFRLFSLVHIMDAWTYGRIHTRTHTCTYIIHMYKKYI